MLWSNGNVAACCKHLSECTEMSAFYFMLYLNTVDLKYIYVQDPPESNCQILWVEALSSVFLESFLGGNYLQPGMWTTRLSLSSRGGDEVKRYLCSALFLPRREEGESEKEKEQGQVGVIYSASCPVGHRFQASYLTWFSFFLPLPLGPWGSRGVLWPSTGLGFRNWG